MRAYSLSRCVLVFAIAVWLANLAVRFVDVSPLGHDEARYAVDTREILDGHGRKYLYVPPGMNVISMAGIALGEDDRSLRLLPMLAGGMFLLSVWSLARQVGGHDTARWSVAVIAGVHTIVRFNCDLLSDLPSAAMILFAVSLMLSEYRRDGGVGWRIIWVAALLACAFYIRYGSCLSIAVVCAVGALFGWSRIKKRPYPVIAMLSLLIVLLIPFAAYSTAHTGTPWGILFLSASVPGRQGEGLIDYLLGNPFANYGVLVPPLALASAWLARKCGTVAMLVSIAVMQIVALGLTTYAQPRFVFVAAAIFVVCGVAASQQLFGQLRLRTAASAAVVAAICATWIGATASTIRSSTHRRAATAPTVSAALQVRVDASGRDCEVLGPRTTQLAWYSTCNSILTPPIGEPYRGDLVYLVTLGTREAGAVHPPGTWCVLAQNGLSSVFRWSRSDAVCQKL